MDVQTGDVQTLASTLGNTSFLRLSPDGNWVYYWDVTVDPATDEPLPEDHVYARVPAEGGTPEVLVEGAEGAPGTEVELGVSGRPLLYEPDGSELLIWFSDCIETSWTTCDASERTLYIVDLDSESVTPIGASQEKSGLTMAFSPDGKHLAYCAHAPQGSLYLTELP